MESLIGKRFSDLARMAIEQGEVTESKTGFRSYFLPGDQSSRGSIHLTRKGDIITMHSDFQRNLDNVVSLTTAQVVNNILFSFSQDGIAVIQNGIIASHNSKLEQLLGYSAGDLANLTVQSLSPQFSDGINASIYMQLREGKVHQGEIKLLMKDGSFLLCHYSCKATNPSDLKQAIVWVFTKIDH
ncbi:MAG TPA: PAS domain S-box protein [Gallionellaceae bacterium]|nr:PAS domain S-box protein [Gallionellaceae bacterium]